MANMVKEKEICEECGGELSEDGTCPTCDIVEKGTEGEEMEETEEEQ